MAVLQRWCLIAGFSFMAGCTGVPEGIEPVTGFDDERYLGTWYEIARLDHSFERGLSSVSAEYRRNGDGSIRVINRYYLWFLSRTPTASKASVEAFKDRAKALGFDLDGLILVGQSKAQ